MAGIIRRGRVVRADLGGGAFVLFVDLPDRLSPETRGALNKLVLTVRAAITAEKEETDAGKSTCPTNP